MHACRQVVNAETTREISPVRLNGEFQCIDESKRAKIHFSPLRYDGPLHAVIPDQIDVHGFYRCLIQRLR